MPSSPGAYWFLDENDQVLYVGKAKNLKRRVTQYALLQDDRPQISRLVSTAKKLKFSVQENELQALLVEAELIRSYQPPFNILLKDDKSSLYINISHDVFPTVFTLRKQQVLRSPEKLTTFGPFQSGLKVRQVLQIARHIFQWCSSPPKTDLSSPNSLPPKPCFYTHIGLCSGACAGKVTKTEYQDMIKHLKSFLRGNSTTLLSELKERIGAHIMAQEFEIAGLLRDQLNAIVQVTSKNYRLNPSVTLPVLTGNMQNEALLSLKTILSNYFSIPKTYALQRIEGYDISNIQGTNASASMVVAINGQMEHGQYRHFGIKTLHTPNDFAMMKEALTRRQLHPEWGRPNVVLIDGGKGQLHIALSTWKWEGMVVSIAKDPDRLIIPLQTQVKNKAHILYKEIPLTQDLPATRLLQTIRDESHRFAKRLHAIKRTNALIK